jgi:hypothetical protein
LLALSAFISIDLSIFSASELASESSISLAIASNVRLMKLAIRVFISYSKHNESDAQCFRRLFEKMEPVIDGKKVVIWTMNQLLAGSAFDEQIQENLNRSVFGFGALSQQ